MLMTATNVQCGIRIGKYFCCVDWLAARKKTYFVLVKRDLVWKPLDYVFKCCTHHKTCKIEEKQIRPWNATLPDFRLPKTNFIHWLFNMWTEFLILIKRFWWVDAKLRKRSWKRLNSLRNFESIFSQKKLATEFLTIKFLKPDWLRHFHPVRQLNSRHSCLLPDNILCAITSSLYWNFR